ncbi:hypothetical protein LCGC14_1167660 [marine sediment metagenome]|uniref:Uncharacterized protein n=1 Tax=marine sediment metagenome TaxID=412755 RepID=A0A0F9MDQ8_9ZZZZ
MPCDRCRSTEEMSDVELSVTTRLTGLEHGTTDRLYLCLRCHQVFNRRWRKFKQERIT